jgi:hypothetical protein
MPLPESARHRPDSNQAAIVAGLRAVGCSVYLVGRPVDNHMVSKMGAGA